MSKQAKQEHQTNLLNWREKEHLEKIQKIYDHKRDLKDRQYDHQIAELKKNLQDLDQEKNKAHENNNKVPDITSSRYR